LCVGGVERVFELGRAFRNEGVDFSHNPSSPCSRPTRRMRTIWSGSTAAGDHPERRDRRQRRGRGAAPRRRDGPLGRSTYRAGGRSRGPRRGLRPLGRTHPPDTELPLLRRLCDGAKIPSFATGTPARWCSNFYERLVEDRTEAPTFYTDFPTSVSPLTRPHRSKPGVAELGPGRLGRRAGHRLQRAHRSGEQRRRLQEQSLLAAGGDPEAMELDEDFLQAMEYAMPPTGGLGMGVDRVVTLITGHSIRDTPFLLARAHADPFTANARWVGR
jgi:lysyl-tRNA synthetase class 2